MTREEAIKEGFLQKKIVYLRPVPRKGKMVNDPAHTAFFMYDGASIWFVLPTERDRPVLVNPFESTEEKIFFERELDVDLNPYKRDNNWWKSFRVKFQKSPSTMQYGLKLDLADPIDNLRWRVLKQCPEVAPNWDERERRPSYRFALVDEDYEDTTASAEMDILENAFTFYGSIKNSAVKMRDFLEIYFMETRQAKSIPLDADKSTLQKWVKDAMDASKETFIKVAEDDDYEMKSFINKCVKRGTIQKRGVNRYDIVGDVAGYNLIELVNYLKSLKDTTDDVYMKLVAQNKLPVE